MLSQRSLGAAGTGLVLPSDDEFNRVSFLSHFDGTNNGVNNVFDDSSSSNHTITANGDVTQGSFGPFARPDGEWGVNFSNDYMQVAGAGNISGDYTLEAWVCMHSDDGNELWLTYNSDGNINAVNFYNGSVSNFLFGTSSQSPQVTVVFNDTTWDAGEWTHLAVVRSSGTLKFYVNGVADSTTSTAFNGNLHDLEFIGTARGFGAGNVRTFNGKISNVRFSSTARYTSNFTPSTDPFTSDSDTDLLTCQSNRFVDNSSNGRSITVYGNPAVSAFGPFLTSEVYDAGVNGASSYFDGTGDYLTVPDSSEFTLGNTFTLEAWIYPTASNNYNSVQNQNGSSGYYWAHVSGEKMQFYRGIGGGIQHDSDASSMVNQWTHVAYVCDAGTAYHYINGVRSGSSVSMSVSDISAVITLGIQGSSFPFPGYICDYRMVVGTAVYSGATYTIPTAPLTAVTNTKLLLNMADGQAIDSAAQNDLTLVGTAKTSTAQSKFGGASLLLDGNSDYANFPETGANDIDGAGDWTAEFFWRFNNNTSPIYQMLLTKGFGLQIYTINGALAIALSANNSGTYFISTTGGTTLSNDTWYHVALVKNGTSYKVYLDGTHETNLGGTSSSTVGTGGGSWHIGAIEGSELTYPANGYMDEVRISRLARYTANFTPPTEAFADKGQ